MVFINYLFKYKSNIFKNIKVINILSNNDYIKQTMSNIFKSNSRFSILVDDTPQQKNYTKKDKQQKKKQDINVENKEERFNSFKSERPIRTESNFRSLNDKGRERYRLEKEEEMKVIKELEERERERIKHESLKIENFPKLVDIPKKEIRENNVVKSKISYIEKLKKDNIVKNYSVPDFENLKPGWVLLKRNPITRQTIYICYPKTLIKEKEEEKSVQEIMMDILKALSEIHEKRTQEYIENYGYDEWERMFKFPDWREREAWLQEMEEMENQTNESEYEETDEEY